MSMSPSTVYSNLEKIDRVDLTTGAQYRQLAQEVLANPQINLGMRQAIAERLNQINQLLVLQTVDSEESY